MKFRGEVTLPDGRKVYGCVIGVPTGPGYLLDVKDVELYWVDKNGEYTEEVTAEEGNIELGDCYLHEYVTDYLLANVEPDEEDYGYE